MVSDIRIRTEGLAGRVTLTRPNALNALTAGMAEALDASLDAWRDDPNVALIIIDAEGEKAFCAGGDIADLYAHGTAGNFAFGQAFWQQEYRLNLKLAEHPKPIVTFLQGFTMGGGVGVGCHASHRIVGESSKIAMPECGIGLVPDIGGSRLLGQAPDGIGVYLGLTGARMNGVDAIHVGFADHYVPEAAWEDLKSQLIAGSVDPIHDLATPPGPSPLAATFAEMKDCFDHTTLAEIEAALIAAPSDATALALKGLRKGAPLALACGLATIRSAAQMTLPEALAQEYRFTHRAQAQGDFLEGIRAQIIDRDFTPKWAHTTMNVPQADIAAMLAPLGEAEWTA